MWFVVICLLTLLIPSVWFTVVTWRENDELLESVATYRRTVDDLNDLLIAARVELERLRQEAAKFDDRYRRSVDGWARSIQERGRAQSTIDYIAELIERYDDETPGNEGGEQ